LTLVGSNAANSAEDFTQLLKQADNIKTSDPSEFATTMDLLDRESSNLTPAQLQYLRYLSAWRTAYRGSYANAIATLKTIIDDPADATLQFRARATVVNVLAIATQYEEAFSQLGHLINQLPNISDGNAREQGLIAAAVLYNRVEQFDLSIHYAQIMISENWGGRGVCKGGQLKLEALSRSERLVGAISEIQPTIEACIELREPIYANFIRQYLAQYYFAQHRFEESIELLRAHFDEVVLSKYPPLISSYESLLASSYREIGDSDLAKQFATRAIASAIKNEYTEPLVNAYRMLYLLAKEQGDTKSALAYYEKYSAADKGYLDDISARQLAYQRVKYEVDAGKLQIDALNKQNKVLQLQRQLDDKAMENVRLYIALLTSVLFLIAVWAYKTKRSQQHFRKLSRRDGLTGIFNRPHFIELAEQALKDASKMRRQVCVVFCDLDHFKSVNDTYGHAQGDYVLQRAVVACQACLRATDVFARIGGEEFGVLLTGCNLEDARSRAEQMRIAVAESHQHDGKFQVSASFGIASSDTSGYDLQTLMTHADAALYRAKRVGRNRVVCYTVEPIEPREIEAMTQTPDVAPGTPSF
jgi:diguanylate cyclase (GGDEF)-like protein